MKLVYKIAVIFFSACPLLLQADDTDIGKFGHVVSNLSAHPVYVHIDISGASDAKKVVSPNEAWKTGKTGKVTAFEVRDWESGILVSKVKAAEDGGKYQVLSILPGANNGKYKGDKYFDPTKAGSRYTFKTERLHDRF